MKQKPISHFTLHVAIYLMTASHVTTSASTLYGTKSLTLSDASFTSKACENETSS